MSPIKAILRQGGMRLSRWIWNASISGAVSAESVLMRLLLET
jgi:hypothetical protein